MADLNNILDFCVELEIKLEEEIDLQERKNKIKEHLKLTDSKYKFIVPEFQKDLQWLNTSVPLTLKEDLRGKITILDFFTYCCINCIHVLPDLEAVEQEFKIEDGVVVVGVHSAKFHNEKVFENVRNAVLRHNIRHPVVNDPDAVLWNDLMINCWPTFVVLGPENQYVHSFAGEGNRQRLLELVRVMVDYYKETPTILQTHSLPISLETHKSKDQVLEFPGKLCLNADGTLVYVADSGNNRILVCDVSTGKVQTILGGFQNGFKDGAFSSARFSNPQGVTLYQNILYVADTDNHAIRKVDFSLKRVETLVGTGIQGTDKEGGNPGALQEISSPMDLILVPSFFDSKENNVLLIAMAGIHQIWAYFFEDTEWFKGETYPGGTCVRVAGCGTEENRNNIYPDKASFAQPSGLAYCPSQHTVYIADCESSSIRSFDLKTGAIKALVGAERNPLNLFSFGDVDGIGMEAKLQHPLGVALLSDLPDPQLLVADTYNHKIKCVDLNSKNCTTLIGKGQPGDKISLDPHLSLFNEPAGLAVDRQRQIIYIADTNNHSLKTFSLKTQEITELSLSFDTVDGISDGIKLIATPTNRITPKRTKAKELDTINVPPSGWIEFKFHLKFEPGISFTNEMPSCWQILAEDNSSKRLLDQTFPTSGELSDLSEQPTVRVSLPPTGLSPDNDLARPLQLFVECLLYTCSSAGTCNMTPLLFKQPILVSESGQPQNEILLQHTVT